MLDEPSDALMLRVLASGSGGNCAVLRVPCPGGARLVLLDAGLSPRRTRALLAESGLSGVPIAAILLTHLDHDHWNAGWANALPGGCEMIVHASHRGRAGREGALYGRARVIDADLDVCGLRVRAVLGEHDELGVAAYRLDAPGLGSLGWATDLGRVPDELVSLFAGVDVLGIESNYCPRMQASSDRPQFLKRRITGGRGHLSNEESADAASRIDPRGARVLLHLSRQCNTPHLARAAHLSSPTPVTVTSQHAPSAWVRVGDPVPHRAPPTLAPHG
ncbi:MAG: MBL fold metallo-hydrolase [Planctomycetota bacterium]|nr:MBL fold metallo-hydrolase [Planctomycetota bacterium]